MNETYLNNLLKQVPDVELLNSWEKQISTHMSDNGRQYRNIGNVVIELATYIPKSDIDINNELKYFYKAENLGHEIDNYISTFNKFIETDNVYAPSKKVYKITYYHILKILTLGLMVMKRNDDGLISRELVNKSTNVDTDVIRYIKDNLDINDELDEVCKLIKVTKIDDYLTTVILRKIFGIKTNHAWYNIDKSFVPSNLNLFIIQIFNRGMCCYTDILKGKVRQDTITGKIKRNLNDIVIIQILKLWMTNTFNLTETVINNNTINLDKVMLFNNDSAIIYTDKSWKDKEKLSDDDIGKLLTTIDSVVVVRQNDYTVQ